jgi:CheY-like chemotaxis protein
MSSILIIDDEDSYLELCKRYMPEHTFVAPARNYREAADILRRQGDRIDLVLLDVHFDIPETELLPFDKAALLAKGDASKAIERLRRSQGLHILAAIRERYPDLPVIVMTSRDDLPLETDASACRPRTTPTCSPTTTSTRARSSCRSTRSSRAVSGRRRPTTSRSSGASPTEWPTCAGASRSSRAVACRSSFRGRPAPARAWSPASSFTRDRSGRGRSSRSTSRPCRRT